MCRGTRALSPHLDGLGIFDCLLGLRLRLGLRLSRAAAIVVGIPCIHWVKAQGTCRHRSYFTPPSQ